jgi:hypothetical protein
MRAKLLEIKQQLRRMHEPVAQTGQWLRSIVQGYFNYHRCPENTDSLSAFRYRVIRLWRTMLIHRGQKHHLTWARMRKLADRWIPRPRVLHPCPRDRFDATSEIRASCGSAARGDLCGGYRATGNSCSCNTHSSQTQPAYTGLPHLSLRFTG